MNITRELLSTAPQRGPWADVLAFLSWARTDEREGVARALWAGLHADRLAYAFAGGYEAALVRLLGARPAGILALAATETGGAHPRAIATRFENGTITGEKTFATLANVADELLVVATRGASSEGKNDLVLVRVQANAAGVTIEKRPDTPFAPEIPHAIVRFERTPATLLPGDGYTAFLKPFRTIEDVHVLAATVGYLLGVGFSEAVRAELAVLADELVRLGAADANDPVTHILLDGAFAGGRRIVAALDWSSIAEAERERWERDAMLLMVAEGARRKRTETAWARLASK